MAIYKNITSNPLLKNTDIILFLNKCDLLKKKLDAGTQFNKWVLSYGERPNTYEGTSACELGFTRTVCETDMHSSDLRKKFCQLSACI